MIFGFSWDETRTRGRRFPWYPKSIPKYFGPLEEAKLQRRFFTVDLPLRATRVFSLNPVELRMRAEPKHVKQADYGNANKYIRPALKKPFKHTSMLMQKPSWPQ